ncbi:MAG: hypothetical protein ACLVC5_09115 [Clostridia bacterium]
MKYIGAEAALTSDPEESGRGQDHSARRRSLGDAAEKLRQTGLADVVLEQAKAGSRCWVSPGHTAAL